MFGGIIADRVLGQHRTILLGAALMAIGHFMMAFEPLFLFALTMLILGNGAFKPNMSAQVGGLYAPGDRRRDRAYSIFYVGINLGAFLAPLVCGTLGERARLALRFRRRRHRDDDRARHLHLRHSGAAARRIAAHTRRRAPIGCRSTGSEWRGILSLLLLFMPTTLFWATYEQQGNTIMLWADDYTDRYIDLVVWQGEIPVTWFQAFNPFMIFAFTPFIDRAVGMAGATRPRALDHHQDGDRLLRRRACQPDHVRRRLDGRPATRRSWLWLLGYFVVITLGELYLSPIGLSLVSKVAPARVVSMMMGVWLATSFVGNFLAGWLGSFWSSMDKPEFFLMIAGIAAAAGVVIWAFNRPLRGIADY